MKKPVFCLTCALILMSCPTLFAEMKTFVRDYTYQAGEMDSRVSCRAIALEQVKRLLLEELGTYLVSETVVRDYALAGDQVTTYTAGAVQTVIVDERWDGKIYWLRAEIKADPDDVADSIDKIRNDRHMAQELAEAKEEAAKALQEIESLKTQLASATVEPSQQQRYGEAVNQLVATDWFEKGNVYTMSGNYRQAVDAYERVIVIKPKDSIAYSNRGAVYLRLGDYRKATIDLDRAVALNPHNQKAIDNRKIVHTKLRLTAATPVPKQTMVPEKQDWGRKQDANRDNRRAIRSGEKRADLKNPVLPQAKKERQEQRIKRQKQREELKKQQQKDIKLKKQREKRGGEKEREDRRHPKQ